jgi:hypothetical protein
MNNLLDSERLANEKASEENKITVAPEGVSDESLIVNDGESIIEELPEKEEEPVVSIQEKEPDTEGFTIESPITETSVAEVKEEEESAEPEDSEEVSDTVSEKSDLKELDKLDKTQIVETLAEKVGLDFSEAVRNEVDALKQAFYKLKRVETEEEQKNFVAAGGLEEDFQQKTDEVEEKLKELLAVFREKKASLVAKEEKLKEDNLILKKQIIEKLQHLIESKEDFYKVYNEFRKLQQRWKEIKPIPQAAMNDLWKDYQHYCEKFYDLVKINNEMRDYDFKKNLELKQAFCEAVEKLEKEPDVISAFYQLQKFHQEWREIGPVAKELREEIWSRFKKASSVINKRHQEHFESLRTMERRNLEEKIAFCEEMEAIDYSKLTTFKDWEKQNKRVLELQDKWKTIGFAPRKSNLKVFERFRAACDTYFHNKSRFYKTVKENLDVNLAKRKALCEKAEALKDSQDWKETTDKIIALQKEWKSIGLSSRKHSESIWKRFSSACDYFFEQKNAHFSSRNTEEVVNLKMKKAIIAKISEIGLSLPSDEAVAIIRECMSEWNKIGFVPFREKDKIQKEYQTEIDKHFDRLKIDKSERRLQSFKSNLNDITGNEKSKNKLLNEREKLMRTYERLKGDIQTYENNIGFLSVSSKGGGGLVKEMNRKIDSLKDELDLIVKKIEVIDENFDAK